MKFGVSTLGYIQVLDADNGNDVDDLVQENHLQYLPSPSSPYTLGNQISSFAWLNIKVVQTWIERCQIFPLILTKEFQMTKLLNNWKWKKREKMAKRKLNFVIRKKNIFHVQIFSNLNEYLTLSDLEDICSSTWPCCDEPILYGSQFSGVATTPIQYHHCSFKESKINWLSNLIHSNRSAAKKLQVLCSTAHPVSSLSSWFSKLFPKQQHRNVFTIKKIGITF